MHALTATVILCVEKGGKIVLLLGICYQYLNLLILLCVPCCSFINIKVRRVKCQFVFCSPQRIIITAYQESQIN